MFAASGCTFSKNADWIKSLARVFDLDLAGHDSLYNSVALFFAPTTIDEYTLKTLADEADEGHACDFYLRCVAGMERRQG